MSAWQQWLHHPESVWWRKCLFHLHVWVGVAIGMYVLMMSLSGSVIVYRDQLSNAFARKPVAINATGPRLSSEEMKNEARRIHPGYAVTEILESESPDQPETIVLQRGTKRTARLVNPYTGADLGNPDSVMSRATEWLVDLHENLLGGMTGRLVNGIGAVCVSLLCLTGAVIWWPGIKHWRRSMSIDWSMPFPRVNWDLHSALGFWFFLFVLLWGISGMYFCFPNAFNAVSGLFDGSAQPYKLGLGDIALGWLSKLHFGRFNGLTKAIWSLVGLVPALMSLTGLFLCCHRIIHKSASPAEQQNHAELPLAQK